MKAIRVHEFGGPEVLKYEEVPDLVPGPGQVVVRVRAVGVNPVETYIRSGAYPAKPNLPYTPGLDAAGVIEAIGSDVTSVTEGQSVYVAGSISGSYAAQTLCLESQVHQLPSPMTFEQGAGVGTPYLTAYRALFHRAKVRPGELVLVHGATGGVGSAAVQLARAAGLTIIGTGGTEKGRKTVAEQGAHYVLDHHAPDYLDQIKSITKGRGVDVVLEMLANINLATDLDVAARFGRVVVIGNRGKIEIDPRMTMSKDLDVLGMTLFNTSDSDRASIHAALVAGLENGTLKPVVGKEMPLADAAKAHEAVLQPGALGKIVLIP